MRILPITITLLFTTFPLMGQVDEMRSVFIEAESHYLFGEYELANPLYLILNDYMPGNANIKYKIGNCYINIPGEQKKAIPFLEDAVKNASYDARPESFRETRAPLDALFSLATAYRINNQFSQALETFSRLNEMLPEKGEMMNMDFIDQQIEACNNAIRMIEEPVKFIQEDMGPYLNPGSINSNPAVSGDGNTLVFTEQRGLENVLFHTTRLSGVWQEPIEITQQLGDAWDCSSSSLNYDGTVLYLYKNDQYDGNIYMSEYDGTEWSKIRKLNKSINTKYYESHASVSMDGKRLYFTSNREGGVGGLDIYVSELNSRGEWGEPVNLGESVNTPFNENTPFITTNDSLLYFSSEGHYNMGGYDLFRSVNQGDGWKTPENLGYPLSTSDDDLFYQPFNQGENGYYSIYTGYKERRIHYITMGEVPDSIPEDIEKVDYSQLQIIDKIDSSLLVTNVLTRDVSEADDTDKNVLYYTVQLNALYNPVDVSFFKDLDVMVFYNKEDRFYRYVTGRFKTREEALERRDELRRMGYPDQIFIQTVYVEDQQ